MKKLLLTTILFTALSCLNANASSQVVVDYQGETFVHQQTMERSMLINCNDGGRYNIAVRPMDEKLRSIDGKVEIPLQDVYLNNTHEDVYIRYNEYSNLFENIVMDGIPHQFTAKVRDFGMIPAGVYNMNFEIQATDIDEGRIASMSMFTLQFVVPTIQEIKVQGELPKITVSTEDVIKKTRKINNESSPIININSNVDWVLSVKTDDFDNTKAKHYIRTIGASSSVRERLQERVLLLPYKEIILAKGKAPSSNQHVAVEFSVENDTDKAIRAGNYKNRVRYILREDRS